MEESIILRTKNFEGEVGEFSINGFYREYRDSYFKLAREHKKNMGIRSAEEVAEFLNAKVEGGFGYVLVSDNGETIRWVDDRDNKQMELTFRKTDLFMDFFRLLLPKYHPLQRFYHSKGGKEILLEPQYMKKKVTQTLHSLKEKKIYLKKRGIKEIGWSIEKQKEYLDFLKVGFDFDREVNYKDFEGIEAFPTTYILNHSRKSMLFTIDGLKEIEEKELAKPYIYGSELKFDPNYIYFSQSENLTRIGKNYYPYMKINDAFRVFTSPKIYYYPDFPVFVVGENAIYITSPYDASWGDPIPKITIDTMRKITKRGYLTMDEIKDILDKNEIFYTSNDKKRVLLYRLLLSASNNEIDKETLRNYEEFKKVSLNFFHMIENITP